LNTYIVVHYGEIGIKGKNRPFFERHLEYNIHQALQAKVIQLKRLNQRLLVEVDATHIEEAKNSIEKTLGVAWYAIVESIDLSYEQIRNAALRAIKSKPITSSTTFKISARRSNKDFLINSIELAKKLGDDIRRELNLAVNLSNPEITIYIDILSDRAIVYCEKVRGQGGLPVGVSGRVMHLFSGGIDSPVAAWLMMKRGCIPILIHFYVAPDAASILKTKIIHITKKLSEHGGKMLLLLIPFSPYQIATTSISQDHEPVVFRHFMNIVAEHLARRFHALAISTGDNLAQVASQTLSNIACIDAGCSTPILRPLLGFDKNEIVELSKRIGTYESSIEMYKDCCSIISRHPKTKLKIEHVAYYSKQLNFDELAEKCISQGSIVIYNPLDEHLSLAPLHNYQNSS
jgi:thiamine biosynthesis protein ThiI